MSPMRLSNAQTCWSVNGKYEMKDMDTKNYQISMTHSKLLQIRDKESKDQDLWTLSKQVIQVWPKKQYQIQSVKHPS